MPPLARGQTWLCQPLPVSTVPNTGRNLSNSNYIEDSMKKKGSSLSRAMGMLPPCNLLAAIGPNRCYTVLRAYLPYTMAFVLSTVWK